MYNTDIKERFFRYCNETAKSESTILKASALFKRTEPIETEAGADICAVSAELLNRAVSGGVLAGRAFYTMISILRQYARWCLENGVPGASESIFHISIPELDKIRSRQVFNETDLKRRLDEVYPEQVCSETGSELFILFSWFAWAQIPMERTVSITADQIDMDSLTVYDSGISYVLSPYARRTAAFLISSDCFRVKNPDALFDSVKRKEGTTLLRGVKGTRAIGALNNEFKINFVKARKDGRTKSSLSYTEIRDSSVFHDIFGYESCGIDPDETITDRKGGIGVSREEYERWKLAFTSL